MSSGTFSDFGSVKAENLKPHEKRKIMEELLTSDEVFYHLYNKMYSSKDSMNDIMGS